ncbi:MAG: PadR family transcriptional regulator [Thermoprotei archaeon]|nr:MAG: PadR family transcriptional regulator [Thermoprotei archaeon]
MSAPAKPRQPVIIRRIAGLMILHFLCEKRMHGYDIWKKLEQVFRVKVPHPIVYKLLREYEEYGLVRSSWVHSETGPAKKIYEITEDGINLLRNNLDFLKKLRDILTDIVNFIEEKLMEQQT